MSQTLIFGGSVLLAIILLVVIITTMYVKAPPSIAFILSGFRKTPRVLIGTGGFKIPIIERLDKVFLGQVTVDVKTNKPVPTNDFINVNVDAVCKVRVIQNDEGTRLAAKNFLNMNSDNIAAQIQDSLEGNMREVVGSLSLEAINTNRDAFSDQIQAKAQPDMAKLGLEIISCNIQNVTDENGLIKDLGADNTYAIKKNAAITKANAERDIEIAQSNAAKEANDVRVKTETEIAERNNELSIKKAELKIVSDTKQADADAAYEIQKQEQQKTINTKTVDAQIEQTKREQVLSEERIRIKENELKAQVNAQADAEKYQVQVDADAVKYQTEINAQAELEKQKREAEAKAYMAEQEAKAIKAKADAAKYEALQLAAGIEAKGKAEAVAIAAKLEAEAKGIEAKGIAEAEAMSRKADAYNKSEFAKLEIITKMQENILPEVAKNVAEPMSKIGEIKIYGGGQEVSGVTGNVPAVMKQTFDVVKDTTGVDMADIMKASSINAKTDKNIKVDGIPAPTVQMLND
jgi:flotillin